MSEIYEKRGSWYVLTEGEDVKQFGNEKAAKASLGWLDTCEYEGCDCDPCECEEG
tara:strand:- start:2874 stop:3038 length:165 start_codon:yes stop_codon:yes gene_type:complete